MRQVVYSYLTMKDLITKISKLSKTERLLIKANQVMDQELDLKIKCSDNMISLKSFVLVSSIANRFIHINIDDTLYNIALLPFLFNHIAQYSKAKFAIHYKNKHVSFKEFNAEDLVNVTRVYCFSFIMYNQLWEQGLIDKIKEVVVFDGDINYGYNSRLNVFPLFERIPQHLEYLEFKKSTDFNSV